jgi:hypothetical protein
VHVDGRPAGRRRVKYAFDLAALTGGRVVGLHVIPPVEVPPQYKPGLVAETAADISSKLALDAREAAAIFREAAARHLADVCWFEAEGEVVEGITDQLDMPTSSSLVSTSGKVRLKSIRCQSLTLPSCGAVGRCWSCPRPCGRALSPRSP